MFSAQTHLIRAAHRSSNNVIHASSASPAPPAPSLDLDAAHVIEGDSDDDDDDDDDDAFYTPLPSPSRSPNLSLLADSAIAAPRSHHPHMQRVSDGSNSSASSLESSSTPPTSDETHSVLSAAASKSSAAAAPSSTSDFLSARLRLSSKPSLSASSRASHSASRSVASAFAPLPRSSRNTYTDEDWAKEVRWLVTPSAAASKSVKSRRRQSLPVAPVNYVDLPTVFQPRPPPPRRGRAKSGRVRTKVLMTALMEEDEDAMVGEDYHLQPASSSRSRSRARTASDPTSSPTVLRRSNSLTTPSGRHSASRNGVPSRSNSLISRSSAAGSSASPRSPYTLSSRTVTLPTPLPVPPPPSSATNAPGTDVNLGATASPSTSGYTTLTLPRAAYTPANPWRALGGGRVDLARDGKAQTTMASVEIVRGVARTLPRGGLLRRATAPRRASLAGIPFRTSFGSKSELSLAHDLGRKKSKGNAPSPRPSLHPSSASALALTSHLSPPSYCPESHVLIQVYAVALEGLDAQIVAEKVADGAEGRATGFVPGRGVVGRVVECGWEVRGEVAKKGEWVVGLLDVRKVRR